MAVILAGIMLPTEALVLPQFMEFRALHLLGTYWALVLPSVAAPVAVFVFYSFIKQVPEELIEAARLDGAGWWRIYRQVCMPLVRPAIVGRRDPHLHHDVERLPVAAAGAHPDQVADHPRRA